MLKDSEIIDLYNEGESLQAFNLIVRKYRERLYWHVRRMAISHQDTDDILQNSFIKIWTGLPSFREESRLFTWIYRIVTNEALTFLKRQRLRTLIPLSIECRQLEADEYFNGSQVQKALLKAISKLPPKQRTVFGMRYFEEMKYEEMSQILDTSVGALKASYHHAYEKIRKELLNFQ